MSEIRNVLVVNCCRADDVLTQREFVWPIQRALSVPSKVISLRKVSEKSADDFDAIILSGCQLQDNEYLKHAKKLSWLRDTKKPVLGICAGQHLLALAFGGNVKKLDETTIGVHPIRITKEGFRQPFFKRLLGTFLDSLHSPMNVYGLHSNVISLPRGFIAAASSPSNPHEVILHQEKPIVGVSFHPEVLNKPLFHAFLALAERMRH